ncbi:unnamed protein product [Haemonchus placei]|uniref:BZIP domain-containing protein n=1 Tax=Haemonchus placei TaxID=6290 RepID=A0A0N4X5N7_HAEPC|nr:unnamed protein product [Haemonchus placei]
MFNTVSRKHLSSGELLSRCSTRRLFVRAADNNSNTRICGKCAFGRSAKSYVRLAKFFPSRRPFDRPVKCRFNCAFDEYDSDELLFRSQVEDDRIGCFRLAEVYYYVQFQDSATLSYVPGTELQFEEVDLSHNDFGLAETPPYSHDIYALHSPSDGYPVDLNDITAALDCDITMLDTYLHSTPCITTSVNDFTVPHQLSESGTHSSACENLSPSSTDPVEEFFPDLCETLTVSTTPTPTRHRNHSSGSVHSTVPHYSPFSSDSATDAFNEYRKRRDKNNLASQRSRQKRAEKMREMRVQKEVLERRNIELKALLSSLEHQVADYKRMVLMVVSKSASFT